MGYKLVCLLLGLVVLISMLPATEPIYAAPEAPVTGLNPVRGNPAGFARLIFVKDPVPLSNRADIDSSSSTSQSYKIAPGATFQNQAEAPFDLPSPEDPFTKSKPVPGFSRGGEWENSVVFPAGLLWLGNGFAQETLFQGALLYRPGGPLSDSFLNGVTGTRVPKNTLPRSYHPTSFSSPAFLPSSKTLYRHIHPFFPFSLQNPPALARSASICSPWQVKSSQIPANKTPGEEKLCE